ncbi:c-type cytochrome [Amphritea sp.]|uniref:c-type cytochrome n=1 Tax=Amphritea sp. TaxID=1872502 RepID=UPI003A93BFB0
MKSVYAALFLTLTSVSHAESSATDGKVVFDQWCVHCHGPSSADHPGTKLLGQRLGIDKAQLQKRSDLTTEYVQYIVRSGIFSMPFFRDTEISDQQLKALATYLAEKK